MNREAVVSLVLVVLFFVSVFPLGRAQQPPIDTSTYYVGTIGQPARLDPALAYDTASGEIIQNVYQPLIWYGDKHPITFPLGVGHGVGHNLSSSEISDLTKYTPVIATQVPTDTNGGIIRNYTGIGDSLWTFTINTNAQFPSWTAADGTVMPAQNVTVGDVVYSFQRQMVYDSDVSPDWMWIETAFNLSWYSFTGPFSDYANGTFVNGANETRVSYLIRSWVYASGGNNVSFHFLCPYPDAAMYQIFSQTWACILEKAWVIEHGGWTGVFYAGWSNDYRRKPSNDYSELDVYKNPAVYGAHGSKYTSGNHDIPDMLGTGPYNFTSWDKTTDTWRIDYNPNYWLGFGNAGDKAGNYIKTVISKGIGAYPTRKMLFFTGEFDEAVVPTANMFDFLTGTPPPPYTPNPGWYTPIGGINLVYNIPALSNDAFLFTMNVSTASPYQSYVGYPGHTTVADPTFFADQNIRTAFSWAFNYTDYINSVFFGETIQHGSWWVDGLTPARANDSFLAFAPYGLRNLNLANMKYYLDQAAPIGGSNVSQNGFDVTFLYNTGNAQRMMACQELADAWNSLGSKYHISVVGVDWPTFSGSLTNRTMPGYAIDWLADFADAADFAGTYMSSSASAGWFSYFQGTHNTLPFDPGTYPADQAIIDAEVNQSAIETDPVARVNEYHDLELRYWTDAISLPLDQPVGRRFARDWVQGWYYNPLLPGIYAYDLYKSPPVSTLWDPIRDSYWRRNYGSFWSPLGNCYGLSSTEILYFTHYILGNSGYPYFPAQNPSATKTSDLDMAASFSYLDNASLAVLFHQYFDPNNNYLPRPDENGMFNNLMTLLGSGTPALLLMAGSHDSTGNPAWHAIVAYGALSNPDGTVSIEVSDPNDPLYGNIATYNPFSQTFYYSKYGLSFFQFEVVTPGMIAIASWWPFSQLFIRRSWNWLNISHWGPYNFVVADKMVTIDSKGHLDYFTSQGNSQTFVCGIPDSCGIEEGDVQVYAIRSGTPYSFYDPGSNESAILVTQVDNESGQPVGSGYLLNASTTQGFLNYTVTPSSAGFSLSTGDNGLKATVTFFSATLQDFSVSQPLNVQVDAGQTVNFTALYVTNLLPSKNIVGKGSNAPVNVTILSMAGNPQNVSLTIFANTTAIYTETIPSLPNGTSTHSFVWNTSSLAYGNYTITALTNVSTNDITIAGGNCTYQTTVLISIAGDINGDGTVDIYDAILLANAFNSSPGSTNWNANADINGDGTVDIYDAIILSGHFNQQIP